MVGLVVLFKMLSNLVLVSQIIERSTLFLKRVFLGFLLLRLSWNCDEQIYTHQYQEVVGHRCCRKQLFRKKSPLSFFQQSFSGYFYSVTLLGINSISDLFLEYREQFFRVSFFEHLFTSVSCADLIIYLKQIMV